MQTDLKQRAISSAIYSLGSHGLEQGLRLAANLILTRLLIPELFGVMAIVNVLTLALGLFSDIGTGPGVIRSKRGLEPHFLCTAWTIRVCRGVILWFCTILMAKPVALFYDNPILMKIFPVVGFGFILSGFSSMAIVTLNKDLQLGKIVIMNIFCQIINLSCMIALAYFYRNVWAFVIGGQIGSFIKLIWSHQLDKTIKHRLMIDPSVAKELFHFGKWIFLSTIMMFLATQADRLMLGKMFSLSLLGVYSIAAGFADLPKNIVTSVSSNVIFPVISIYSSLPRQELRNKILQKRKLLLAPLAILVALFAGFGDFLIIFLYDARYIDAAWILPILSLGMWPLLLYSTIDRALYVIDSPIHPAAGNCFKFLYMITCLPVAFHLYGTIGAVLVVACNDFPAYIAINYGLKQKGLSGLKQDLLATAFLSFLLCIILLTRFYFDFGLPGAHT